ncbi:MAG: hypothetical protein OEL57_02385 [Trichlorobacter sp.]|uniref:hypothetical protein n=1 Tax=Trichlorobacter sp. TaxID=2911007 RepID=UPI002563CE2C|nr:hypothetical protein [Trichlorobacter sp.]MDK9716739.1 hypothetical protein [Trichlorobacter sp.]
MANKTYLYQGPVATGITLPPKKEGDTPDEKLMHPGKTYSLPEDNERVKTLLAKEYLVEQSADPAPAQEPAKAVKAKETSSAS